MRSFLVIYSRSDAGGAAHEPQLLRALEPLGELELVSPGIWLLRDERDGTSPDSLADELSRAVPRAGSVQLVVAPLATLPVVRELHGRAEGRSTGPDLGSPLGSDPETLTY